MITQDQVKTLAIRAGWHPTQVDNFWNIKPADFQTIIDSVGLGGLELYFIMQVLIRPELTLEFVQPIIH